jgi:two-component system, cell cycle sensor histidine kinase and response regulator CckA
VVDLKFSLEVEDDWVQADAVQLERVVLNLLLNAAEAMPDGGTVVVRTTSVDAAGRTTEGRSGWVALSVEDQGVGIPERDHERIFDPFYTTKDVGCGLGLSAVRGIVRAHRGKVVIESEPDRGTAVRVLLPLAGPGAGSE